MIFYQFDLCNSLYLLLKFIPFFVILTIGNLSRIISIETIAAFDTLAIVLPSLVRNRMVITMESKARKRNMIGCTCLVRRANTIASLDSPCSSHRNDRPNALQRCSRGETRRRCFARWPLPPKREGRLKLVERDLFSLAHASVPPLERL